MPSRRSNATGRQGGRGQGRLTSHDVYMSLPASPPDGPLETDASSPVGLFERSRRRRWKRPVRWLAPIQLLRTAAELVTATVFARFADKREAMASTPRQFYALHPKGKAPETVWVDFVADTGDGFDATYATARVVAGDATVVWSDRAADFEGRPERRAELLVFGGDQVYPVASAEVYEARFNKVYRTARLNAPTGGTQPCLEGLPPERAQGGISIPTDPPMVALPGNHDWYDGLVSFRRNFCEAWVKSDPRDIEPQGPNEPAADPPEETPMRPIDQGLMQVPETKFRDAGCGWGAFQSRSYFAIRLNDNWWLWGLDSQLDAPIDAEQLDYFRGAAHRLGDANLILCTAKPSWYEASGANPYSAPGEKSPLFTLLWFVDRILGQSKRRQVRLVVTGDIHHYARYVPDDDGPYRDYGPYLVTCGGGGAFLSSTHHLSENLTPVWRPWEEGSPTTTYRRVREYPSKQQSKDLLKSPRFLRAALRNGLGFPALVGLIDLALLFSLLLLFWLWRNDHQDWAWTTRLVLLSLVAVFLLVFFLPVVLFAVAGTKGRSRGLRRSAATALLVFTHTVVHVAVATAVATAVWVWVARGWHWLGVALAFPVLAVLGTLVVVTYLRVADLFGFHQLEAFAAHGFTQYKSHLRMAVRGESVTVHVVGIDKVPKTPRGGDPPQVVARVVETFLVYPGHDADPADPGGPAPSYAR
jgi:hypothetical protein